MNSFSFRFFITLVVYLLSMSYLYAGAEENACFDILKQKTNSLYGVDLTSVFNGSSNVDISTYAKFQGKKYRPTGNAGGFFNSQRNNIGTIFLSANYITTQYVPIGNPTNFKFPIDASGSLIGAEFSNFRNQMVYTHHNIFDGGSFLSCGYLKITPYATYTFNDLDPSNYFTNIIDGGGFEIQDSKEVSLGAMGTGHYIVGKSVVQGATKLGTGSGTTLTKLFKVDIINVIYDNGSTYFNEYETYPLQVDAMTNADTFTTAWSLQQDFSDRVMNETCLSFVHSGTVSLPAFCGGSYQSLSAGVRTTRGFALDTTISNFYGSEDFFTRVFSLIVPQASAALESDELKAVQTGEDTSKNGIGNTIMMDSNFDYFEYQKINSLPSKILKDYIFSATNYQVELDLRRSVASGAALSEYETVLLGCGITYPERVKLIKKWIQEIDLSTFSLENIEYPDPKIGDCVIPFPDKRNADKVISGSFESNQKYARYLNDVKAGTSDIRIQDLKKKLQDIEKEYANTIQQGNILISGGKTVEGGKVLSAAALEYEPQIEKIQNEMRAILNPESSPSLKEEKTIVPYVLIIFGFFICLMVVFTIRRNKNQQISNQ